LRSKHLQIGCTLCCDSITILKKILLVQKKNIEALSDEDLLKAFLLEKENRFLGALLERHIRFVFVVCMKYLRDEEAAKDMTMKVFEKVTEDVCRFEIQNFKSWLHVVTKNSCLMHIRGNKHFKTVEWKEDKDFIRHVENHAVLHLDDSMAKEERLADLEKAVETLEPGQQQCIKLFYLDEKSYKDVVEITGLTLNQVKSHIQNGKRNLKNLLVSKNQFMLMVFIFLYFD